MLKRLIILLFCCLFFLSGLNAAIPQTERDALIAFYNSTNGDSWNNNSNWRKPGDPAQFNDPGTENTWFGVTLDAGQTRVESLIMNNNGLSGPLPATLTGLSQLKTLELNFNQISGTPPDLSACTYLQELKLTGNDLAGSVPSWLNNITSLTELELRGNQFSGPLPALGGLTSLTWLDVSANQLSGDLPLWLRGLTQMQILRLDDNQFTGALIDLSPLVNLESLYLSENQLTGTIPTWLSGMWRVRTLLLSDNQFTGTIPALTGMTGLQSFHLANNQLTGAIPAEINNMTALQQLNLSGNQLSGDIPNLGNLTALTSLTLSNNQLTGPVPSWLGNLVNLTGLSLDNNQLTGAMDNACAVTPLSTLYLNGNALTGPIPPEIGNLTNLASLRLYNNRLSGNIPTEIGNLTGLQYLWLQGNRLTGSLPATLSSLTDIASGIGFKFSWNGLYSDDSALKSFILPLHSGDWEATQTIAPTNPAAGQETDNSIKVTWTTVSYTVNPGGYKVYASTTPGSGYELKATIDDKATNNTVVTGLEPGTAYYFVAETFTDPHAGNVNTVVSGYSTEVSASTTGTTLEVTAPNGAEILEMGVETDITWDSAPSVQEVVISVSTDNGANWEVIAGPMANLGLHAWTVPNTASDQCLIKVEDTGGTYSDTSDNVFTIQGPTITVQTPVNGEFLDMGYEYNITWTHTGQVNDVVIHLSTDGGTSWNMIAGPMPNNGLFAWTIPNIDSADCFIKVEEALNGLANDANDQAFTIQPPTITVQTPVNGEYLDMGYEYNITWSHTGKVDEVVILLSTDGGSQYNLIAGPMPNNGLYAWTVPNIDSADCFIKVEEALNGLANDTNNEAFIIAPPTISVQTPVSGEYLEMGYEYNITWAHMGKVDEVAILLSTDGGNQWNLIAGPMPNTGMFAWTVPNIDSMDCFIKVEEALNGLASDTNDQAFTIAPPSISVQTPVSGEYLEMGYDYNITWTHMGKVEEVAVLLSTDGGNQWDLIAGPMPNTGIFTWRVPNIGSTDCFIKVEEALNGLAADTNDQAFTIAPPNITVQTPVSGEYLEMGYDYNITWTHMGKVDEVAILLSTDGGNQWDMIGGPMPNTGVFAWTVPNIASNDCYIKVEDSLNGLAADTNNQPFVIIPPTITVQSPVNGEMLQMGSGYGISWVHMGLVNQVMISFSSDGGTNWEVIAGPMPNNGLYNWTVPNTPSTDCFIRVEQFPEGLASDTNDQAFIIEVPTIDLLYPDGGEVLDAANSYGISWDSTGPVDNVVITYSSDGGSTWNPVVGPITNTGMYLWTPPSIDSTQCLVKVEEENAFASDTSQDLFTIQPAQVDPSERDALIALYNSTNGSAWLDNTNWRKPGDPSQFNDPGTEHTWFGITCNGSNNSVTHIDLTANNLSGILPAQLNNLPNLTSIRMASNQLTGLIPDFNNLTLLTELVLGDNNINNAIPASIGNLTQLTLLSLEKNNLGGGLPAELGNLTALTAIYLQGNRFSGPVPVTFSSLTGLPSGGLDISYNGLHTADAPLKTFLDSKQVGGDWESTQTIAPTGISVGSPGEDSIELNWIPIPYQSDGGGYRIYSSTTGGSGYTEAGMTLDKYAGSYTVTGLDPDTTYYFVVTAVTTSHTENPNAVESEYSGEVSGSTETVNLTVLTPNGTETLEMRDPYTITWETGTAVTDVILTVTYDNGAYWDVIAGPIPNSGSYEWTVPEMPSGECLIQVWDALGRGGDVSDSTFTILSPTITITSPNNTTQMYMGNFLDITWTHTGNVNQVNINYSIDGGAEWIPIAGPIPNSGMYTWQLPNTASTDCLVQVSEVYGLGYGTSNTFTILGPEITITSPAAGLQDYMGNTLDITWTHKGNVNQVNINYSIDGGAEWIPIAGPIPNSGMYTWQLPNNPSSNCLVMVSEAFGLANGTSETFTILSPQITITSPTAGTQMYMGYYMDITWTHQGNVNQVNINYSTDGGAEWYPIAGPIPNSGQHTWLLPNAPSSDCQVMVSEAFGLANGFSGTFSIMSPQITITAPTAATSVYMGDNLDITWSHLGKVDQVNIMFSSDGGADWQQVAGPIPNTGMHSWQVPNTASTQCIVQVSEVFGTTYTDSAPFTIMAPQISLTNPYGGLEVIMGSPIDITWAYEGNINTVDVFFSSDGGNDWQQIAAAIPNTGMYTWDLPNIVSSQCMIQVSDVYGLASGTNGTPFSIVPGLLSSTQRDALIALYNSTNGDGWSNNSNWRDPNNSSQFNAPGTEYTWYGVTTDFANSRVESINLEFNGLTGTLPGMLMDLTQLQSLKLNGNQIGGNLSALAGLDQLQHLDLSDNQLTGTVPMELGNMSALTYLNLGNNRLSGAIAPETGNLTGLTTLKLESNQLSGTVPVTFSSLTNLPSGGLDIGYNGLYTADAALKSFLDSKQVGGDWENTQTIAPTGLATGERTHDSVTVSWIPAVYQSSGGGYRVYYSTTGGSGYTLAGATADKAVSEYTVTGLSDNTTYYFVVETVTDPHPDNGNTVVSGYSQEVSAETFETPTLSVLTPNGTESWEATVTRAITWNSTGNISDVKIEYSTDNGNTWNTVTASTPDTGTFDWLIPNTPSVNCLVKISDTGALAEDSSDAVFTIAEQRTLSLTAPNGTESWEGGTSNNITWNSTGSIANVKIEFSTDNGTSWNILAASAANNGSYGWTVPNTPSTNCLVRITDTAGPATDNSNGVFTIAEQRSITVSSPNGTESWEGGTNHNITWNSTGSIANVQIEYSTDNGGSWNNIALTGNDGSLNWSVPNSPSTSCLVRISDSAGPASDTSNNTFTIAQQRSLTVLSPDGSENWEGGTNHTVSWAGTGSIGNVGIEYSTDNGGSWNTVTTSTSNNGSYNWTVPNTPSTSCLIKVSDVAGPASDTGNGAFTIAAKRTISVTAPDGGESWEAGTTHTITWNHTGAIPNVNIEYSTDSGSNWNSIAASTTNSGSYNWVIPGIDTSACLVRVSDASGPASDTSNGVFALWQQPSLTITAPDGGESWYGGTTETITWDSTGSVGNVKIEYTKNNGGKWKNVVTSTANTGSFQWAVPTVNKDKNRCRVRITALDGSCSDTSNAKFTIKH